MCAARVHCSLLLARVYVCNMIHTLSLSSPARPPTSQIFPLLLASVDKYKFDQQTVSRNMMEARTYALENNVSCSQFALLLAHVRMKLCWRYGPTAGVGVLD